MEHVDIVVTEVHARSIYCVRKEGMVDILTSFELWADDFWGVDKYPNDLEATYEL